MSSKKAATLKKATATSSHPVDLALASHEEVVRDGTLFMNTLTSFHFALKSKLVIPVIGGRDLNLHTLYVEVTRRGGYEKVVLDKKWREVGTTFGFPETTTSASYALRKHYLMLLHRYELVYYFRIHDATARQGGHASFHAVGTIEGRFDYGYFVSVKVGTEMLHGVLYHPGQSSGSSAIVPVAAAAEGSEEPSASASAPPPPLALPAPKRARKSRKRRAVDPQRPKPNKSGYNFFFAERHTALKSQFPEREREFTKMIGNAWTNLPEEQKLVYNDYGVRDKERYHRELEEYKTMIKGKAKAKAENA